MSSISILENAEFISICGGFHSDNLVWCHGNAGYNGIIPVDDLHCYEKAFEILEKKLNEKYTVEQIVDTLREMNMHRPGEKLGYNPAYTRTDLTDDLHAVCGFRTDYEIITDMNMKKVIRESKKK